MGDENQWKNKEEEGLEHDGKENWGLDDNDQLL